jgi:hypothetical protein
VAERRPQIRWPERRDGAIAGLFFGAIGAAIHLAFSLIVGLAGWWRDTAETFGRFMAAQVLYSVVIILGIMAIGAFWDLRKVRIGRLVLWLAGGLLVSGALISLLKAPVWKWNAAVGGWLLIMGPAFAWVFGLGSSRR